MNYHDAQVLLDQLHQAQNQFYAGGDVEPVISLLTTDVHWSVPGDNDIAGDYVGLSAVIEYLERRRRLAGCTLRLIRRDVLVGHGHLVAALTDALAVRDGQLLTWSTVGLYAVQDARIRRCWLLPLDIATLDGIWS